MTDWGPIEHFEGICDVCGGVNRTSHNPARGSNVDVWIDADGSWGTWARHYATAPPGADPDCAKYFSRLRFVRYEPSRVGSPSTEQEANGRE